MKLFSLLYLQLSCCSCLLLSSCSFVPSDSSLPLAMHLREAEIARKDQKLDLAIEHYEHHIAERLEDPKRPEWENPHFYLLFIGDLYLEKNDVQTALAKYEEATNHGIEKHLISDRFRYVANWHVTRGNPKKALEILAKYRDYDPLLFDIASDRIARELVATEDAKRAVEKSLSEDSQS